MTPLAYRTADDCIAVMLRDAARQLAPVSDTARLDAELLLGYVLGITRDVLYMRPEQRLSAQSRERYMELVKRCASGESVAYLVGSREFWSMALHVTPDTLIPRPETELLVEAALARIPESAAWSVADIGTGSGAIALAIARERPACRVYATDSSGAALDIARKNAEHLGLHSVECIQGDWLEPLAGQRLDLVASNPPYVREGDPHLYELRHEPRAALVAGPTGLEAIERIIAQARDCLVPGGYLLLEHGYDQAAKVAALFRAHGYREVCSHRDLSGHVRVSEAHACGPEPASGNHSSIRP